MKSRANDTTAVPASAYPCLKRTSRDARSHGWDYVVMFFARNTGVVVHVFRMDPDPFTSFKGMLGEYYTEFGEDIFEPYDGEVTLSN